jgi:tetratricopeptide (TPR) repeat protein
MILCAMTEENQKERPAEPEAVPSSAVARPRPLWKSILFTVILVAAFFGALELALALVGVRPVLVTEDPFIGFAENIPLFVEERQPDGSVLFKTAENKNLIFNKDQSFPKEKGSDTYRIFCLGESTTYGHPYDDKLSYCGWLRAFLKTADRSRRWEVINAGGISYASYRITRLMEELKQYQPDLFIVYVGQNEFLEQRSYGRLMALPDWALRAGGALSGTRSWAAMKKAIDAVRPDPLKNAKARAMLGGEVDEILNHTLGPTSYRRDDTLKGQIIRHYRLSLGRMVEIAGNAGADILFVQPAINLKDFSPFKSEHKEGLDEASLGRWQAFVQNAEARQEAGNPGEALAAYREALQIDDRYAELHYRIGRLLFGVGQYDNAEKAFQRAVDEDVAPLRILSPMRRAVEEVASKYHAPLVDFPKLLKEATLKQYGHAVPGKEYFVDHVHTNLEAYRLLALALLDQMIKRKIAAPGPSWDAAALETVDREMRSRLDRRSEGLALKRLGKTLDWAGRFDEAHQLFLQALDALGPDAEIYLRLTAPLVARGAFDEAIFYLRQAIAVEPARPDIHQKLAKLLALQGKTDEAIEHYREELRHYPNHVIVHTDLATLLARKGENEEARRHFETALKLVPDFEYAQLNFAILLTREGQYEESIAQSRAVLRLNPAQPLAHLSLGVALQKQGKREEAIPHFTEAVRLKPDDPAAKKALEEALAERGR